MSSKSGIYHRKLRMAMIGGGPGAFIGEVHRKAARLDGEIELVAGAFSSNPEKSKQQGAAMYLDPARVYGAWEEMLEMEAKLPIDQRIDLVSIVTPNNLHCPPAKMAMEKGFHVVCDKPLAITSAEAKDLAKTVEKTKRVFALTHTYTGNPMVKLARDLVRHGKLGSIRKVVVEYPQGWLFQDFEKDPNNKQAGWRTDPILSGAGCLGDIGTHAANLSEYVTGLKLVSVAADVSTFVKNRRVDDDINVLGRWEKGAKGVLHASQVAVGEENDIAIYVYGDKASLEWHNCKSDYLEVRYPDKPKETWSRGWPYVAAASPLAARATRLPSAHPEGCIEAFANIYMNAAATIRAIESGKKPSDVDLDFPNVEDGVRGMLFIEAVLKSSREGSKWIDVGN